MTNPSEWDVVIVDDEPDNVGVLELVLEYQNAKVRVANSGPGCLDLLRERVPSLLLIDIQMPEMSGDELLRLIRKGERWQRIPAIAITAYAMSEDQARILSAGFDGYITKPVNAMTFVDEVKTILSSKADAE